MPCLILWADRDLWHLFSGVRPAAASLHQLNGILWQLVVDTDRGQWSWTIPDWEYAVTDLTLSGMYAYGDCPRYPMVQSWTGIDCGTTYRTGKLTTTEDVHKFVFYIPFDRKTVQKWKEQSVNGKIASFSLFFGHFHMKIKIGSAPKIARVGRVMPTNLFFRPKCVDRPIWNLVMHVS